MCCMLAAWIRTKAWIVCACEYKGQRRENMLFGDGHVEFYRFPKETFDALRAELRRRGVESGPQVANHVIPQPGRFLHLGEVADQVGTPIPTANRPDPNTLAHPAPVREKTAGMVASKRRRSRPTDCRRM